MSGSPSKLLSSVPDEWGPKFETSSGAVTRTLIGPNSIKFNAPSHMALVMLTPQSGREVSLNSDRKSRFLAPVGTVEIIPSDAEVFARWKGAKENLLLAVAPEQLSRLAGLELETEDFEFQSPAPGHVDEKALLLANLVREEFQSDEPLNHLYMDSLMTVFSTYLLRNYSTFQAPDTRGDFRPKPCVMFRITSGPISVNRCRSNGWHCLPVYRRAISCAPSGRRSAKRLINMSLRPASNWPSSLS